MPGLVVRSRRTEEDVHSEMVREESLSSPTATASTPPTSVSAASDATEIEVAEAERTRIRMKNRRKRYIDVHPEYFQSPNLELADPLLYDRLVRRFQTPAEREADGRRKGFSGVLQANLIRGEAKLEALAHPDPDNPISYKRGANGEIIEEEEDEKPRDKEDALARWQWAMEMRFLEGRDDDFDYSTVDESEEYDDWAEEDRMKLDEYLLTQEPEWCLERGKEPEGETGIQDF